MMLSELARDENLTSFQLQSRFKILLDYFRGKLVGRVLDIGNYNHFTCCLENSFQIEIENTYGDLDETFTTPSKKYDTIICSHIIEHVFNPLFLLSNIRRRMKKDGILYLVTPLRPKFLGCPGHFHEFSRYEMQLLTARAEFRIKSDFGYKGRRVWWFYFTGLKPLLRLFFEYGWIYELVKT